MGISGCGKSRVGRLLAADLGCPFIEGDDHHDASCTAKMRAGIPLTDEDRWPWLDRIGAAMQLEVAKHGVAVAACSALKQTYRDRLIASVNGRLSFVLLEIERADAVARLENRTGHFMPASLLDSQLALLEPPSQENALTLDARQSPSELLKAIRDWLPVRSQPHSPLSHTPEA